MGVIPAHVVQSPNALCRKTAFKKATQHGDPYSDDHHLEVPTILTHELCYQTGSICRRVSMQLVLTPAKSAVFWHQKTSRIAEYTDSSDVVLRGSDLLPTSSYHTSCQRYPTSGTPKWGTQKEYYGLSLPVGEDRQGSWKIQQV